MELQEQRVRFSQSFKQWLGNIITVFKTTINGLLITLRYWRKTYDPDRRTFTEHTSTLRNRFRFLHVTVVFIVMI